METVIVADSFFAEHIIYVLGCRDYKTMFNYTIAIITGGFLQIGTVYFLRGDFFRNFFISIPVILVYQFLFLWSYSTAPKFITIWFTAAALTSLLGFLVGYFLWKEQVSLFNFIGIVLIILGMVFLKLK